MTSKYDNLLTPCYLFDEEEFDRGVAALRTALARCFERFEIGYSFKTNTLPYAIKRGRELGCRAEVVSHDEYELARLCGFGVDEIIYNGPMKSRHTFLEALAGGAIVNIETKREIEWLESYRGDRGVSVGIRLNIDLNEVNPKEVGCCDGLSRFGFSEKAGEFGAAVARIAAIPGVRLVGLHIHRTTDARSVGHYRRAVEFACGVIRKYDLSLEYLDIGGGFFGIMRNKPSFAEYAKGIHEVLEAHQLHKLKIIVEPGFAILSNPFKFVTRVIDSKCVGDDIYFVTTDGSRNDIDPMFRKTGHKKDIYRRTSAGEDRLRVQMVSGCSCMENDRLFTLRNEARLECGDIIVYHGVGAYTMTLSPMFIRMMPRVYARDRRTGELREVRRAGSATDLLFQGERES